MNNFIKQVIEEKFASKAQQRLFFAKAKGGKNKKWSKWAKEFSDETDYSKIPDKVEKEEEVDEIVDKNGNILTSKKPSDLDSRGVSSNSTSDEVALTGKGMMGNYGMTKVQNYTKFWGEGKLTKGELIEIAMKDALGFDATMGNDADYEEAEEYFEKDLGLDSEETEDRMDQMGYDKNLPDDKVRLVENPKKYMEEYIESILKGRSKDNDVLEKEKEEVEPKEIHPIIKRQLNSLKNSMDNHNLSMETIVKYLSDVEVNLKK
jgi:hypothetical protein